MVGPRTRRQSWIPETLEHRRMLAALVDVATDAGLSEEHYFSGSMHSLGVVWIDVNNDSYPDIFATNGWENPENPLVLSPHLYINDRNGGFIKRDDLLPPLENIEYVGAKAADYDRDGDMDLYVYTAHETFAGGGMVNAHLNPDDGPANLLLKNNFIESGGAGSGPLFVDVAAEAGVDDCPDIPFEGDYGCYQTRSAAFLDYDLDGWLDLYVGHMVMSRTGSMSDPVADAYGKVINEDILYRNNGDGTFSKTTGVLNAGDGTKRGALATVAGYINDDPYPDIYVGNAGDNEDYHPEDYHDTILLNSGNGTFEPAFEHLGDDTPAAMGIDFGDVNGDGQFDIYITDVFDHPENGDDPTKAGNTYYRSAQGGLTDNLATFNNIEGRRGRLGSELRRPGLRRGRGHLRWYQQWLSLLHLPQQRWRLGRVYALHRRRAWFGRC